MRLFYISTASRVSSLSASGRSYGETSAKNQAANGRILSQPSTPDKDAITYPDELIRDSYGNIVTPYTTLLEDTVPLLPSSPKPSSLGLLTDVNRDNGQHLQFVIPSYSDGITELQGPYKPSLTHAAIAPPLQTLLPPLSSGNYNYPSLDTHTAVSPDNSYQNEVGGSFPASPQNVNSVPNGQIFTPNLQVPFTSSSSNAPNQPTKQVSYESQGGIASQPESKTSFTSNSNNPIASNAPVGSSDFSAIHVTSPQSPTSSFAFSNTKPLKDTQIVNQKPINIQVDNGKYTGGFGGAPGILGEQKVPGYAVKPTVSSNSQINNDHPGFNSVHAHSPVNTQQQAVPVVPNQSIQAPPRPNNINQSGSTGQINTNHGSFQFGTAFSTNPTPTPSAQLSNNGKYTGGFGGPPGIYSPFDNVKSGKTVATGNSPTSNNQG